MWDAAQSPFAKTISMLLHTLRYDDEKVPISMDMRYIYGSAGSMSSMQHKVAIIETYVVKRATHKIGNPCPRLTLNLRLTNLIRGAYTCACIVLEPSDPSG